MLTEKYNWVDHYNKSKKIQNHDNLKENMLRADLFHTKLVIHKDKNFAIIFE